MNTGSWGRRDLLKAASAGIALAAFSVQGVRDAAAQQVKWSSGTEPPKLKAPANACDCHHHIYGSQYKVDPRIDIAAGRRHGRGLPRVTEAHRHQPQCRRAALDLRHRERPDPGRARRVRADGAGRRGRRYTVTDAELKRMHEQGARGIRFNLAQAGATTPEMIEPLSKRINDLGWHIQINAGGQTIMEIMPILQNVPTPIVFDHLAHIPAARGRQPPALRAGPRADRQGKDLGQAVGRLCRHQSRAADLCRRDRGGAGLRKAAPERLVWGSDWPHPGEPPPNRSRTMPCCSTCCSYGRPTRSCATAFWSRTRRCSTISRRVPDLSE